MNFLKLFFVATLGSFLFSCASARVDFVDPDLSPTSLKAKSVAIGGVVIPKSMDFEFSRNDAKAVQSAATKILERKRRDLAVVSSTTFSKQVGSGNLVISSDGGNLLTEAFSSSQISKAKNAGIGFVLLIKPSSNRVARNVRESSSTDTDYEYDDEGKIISSCSTTTYTTSADSNRRIQATYHLYDLATEKQVWQTSSNHSETHSNSRCSTFCYPSAPPYPSPPSIGDVMENMTAAVTKKLPKERFQLFAKRG